MASVLDDTVAARQVGHVRRVARCRRCGLVYHSLARPIRFACVAEACRRFRLARAARRDAAAGGPAIRRAVLARHPRGWSDSRIARELGVPRWRVRAQRQALGLPVVSQPGPPPEVAAVGTLRRFAAQREESASLGWPPVTAGRRRILEAIEAEGGRATLRQVNRRNGTRVEPRHKPMAGLLADGHVVVAEPAKPGGKAAAVYALAAGVAERRARHLAQEGEGRTR